MKSNKRERVVEVWSGSTVELVESVSTISQVSRVNLVGMQVVGVRVEVEVMALQSTHPSGPP